MKRSSTKLNVVVLGAGHYSTGTTSLTGRRATDKDLGVLLPSVLALKLEGLVERVALVATDGSRLSQTALGWIERAKCLALPTDFECLPDPGVINTKAYVDALRDMPKPCAALIAVPDHLHTEVMLACIATGVHFLVVKPAVTTLKDLHTVIDAIEDKPVFGMVDYHKVFDEANVLIKHELRQGSYGKLQHVTSLMTQRRDILDIYAR